MQGGSAAAQTFEESEAAYNRGDYTTALQGFRRLAEQGNAGAQYNLGVMYARGEGVPKGATEAAKWYCRAAEQGEAKAHAILGVMYSQGTSVPQDDTEAAKWYRRAAEQGHAGVQYLLAGMYYQGTDAPKDDAEAAGRQKNGTAQTAQVAVGVTEIHSNAVLISNHKNTIQRDRFRVVAQDGVVCE